MRDHFAVLNMSPLASGQSIQKTPGTWSGVQLPLGVLGFFKIILLENASSLISFNPSW